MKTIDEAAKEEAAKWGKSTKIAAYMAFEEGVDFAEEWISVEDELPTKEHKAILLMYDNNSENVVSGFVDVINGIAYPHYRFVDWKNITHWRPINRK